MKEALDYAERHETFRHIHFPQNEELFLELAEKGQTPKTLFIGCSDSRVIPELITSAKPGDFFVIRNAGNFVPTYDPTVSWDGVAATIEYAVNVLNIRDIIVCGHSDCGAISALFSENQPVELPLIQRWLRFGEDAKRSVNKTYKGDLKKKIEIGGKVSVVFQLENLLTYPFIKERFKKKEIILHAWYFNIGAARIEYFDPETDAFVPLFMPDKG